MKKNSIGVLLACVVFFMLIACPMEPKMYTITFYTNGGSAVVAQTVQENGRASRPAINPTKAGYSFDDWYAQNTLDTVWNFDTPITGDRTLYAMWASNTYQVTYDANGATGGTPPSGQDKIHDVILTLTSNSGNLVRTDFIFKGWNTCADGSGTSYAEGSSYAVNAALTLYARWLPRPITKSELISMISNGDDLTSVNTSEITDMSELFKNKMNFNQDISDWDVSHVTNMSHMFDNASSFNQDISDWEVINVTDMSGMFCSASAFNQDISNWDVSHVTNMSYMFDYASTFNQDISDWDVSSVTDMSCMFLYAFVFNQDISGWIVDSVTNMSYMFSLTSAFNQDISGWKVDKVTDMSYMFSLTSVFNQDISNWNVGSVTNMSYMFYNASAFDQNISGWDVHNVTDHTDFSSESCPLTTEHHPVWNE
ncbi:MAG: BspA family leucine-rich repeat surface protein [Sphaerochaetaceae bacterium]